MSRIPSSPSDRDRTEPEPAQRVRMDVGARRAHLLEIGIRVFTEHHYDDVDIVTIATAAGISRGLLYRYFPDKASFFAEVVADRLQDLAARSRPEPPLTGADHYRFALDAFFDVIERRPQWYVSMYRGSASSTEPVRNLLDRFDAGLIDSLVSRFPGARDTPLTRVLVRGWLSYLAAIGIAVIDGAEVDRAALGERCLRVVSAVAEACALPDAVDGR